MGKSLTNEPKGYGSGVMIAIIAAVLSLFFLSCREDTSKTITASESELESRAAGGPHLAAKQIASDEFGLANMTVDISASEVKHQSAALKNKVTFEEALHAALKSFLEDGTDLESPLGLIKNDLSDNAESEQKGILFEYLNRPSTSLKLVSPDTDVGYPERGESTQENWVFYLYIESYSDHLYWAIVDRSGKRPTYNYGFN